MDPGRRRIEEREWSWLAVGDVVMDDHGVRSTVAEVLDHRTLVLRDLHTHRRGTVTREPDATVRAAVVAGADAALWSRVRGRA